MPRLFQRPLKPLLILLALGLLCMMPQADGATVFSGTYSFGSGGNVDSFAYNGTAISNLTVGDLTKNGVTSTSSSGNFRASGWSLGGQNNPFTGGINLTTYFEFTLTAETGFELDMTSITFGISRSATGPRQWEWRSSVDSFGSTIAPYTSLNASLSNNGGVITNPDATTGYTGNVLDLSGAAFQGLTTITFRFYGYNAEQAGGTGGFHGDLSFAGTLSSTGPPPSDSLYFLGDDATLGGAGTWAASGGTAWAPNADGSGTAQAWDASKIARFNSPSTVNVSGNIDLNQGLQITADTTLSGGTLNMAAATQAENGWNVGTASTATVSSEITGNNGMTKTGNGTLILIGTKTYAGGTTVSGGTLQLGDGTSNGTVAGNVVNNATVAFHNGSAQTFGGDINGSGSLIKNGGGALTLSGTNSYSGGTTVSAGSLIGTTSSLQGAITNNAAVTFDQAGNGTYAGNMSGSGSLTKSGAGAVTLSGSNSYSGGTTVSAGSLIGTTSSLQGDITNNAAVTFDQASDGTYAGNMTGSGSLSKTGAGAVTLSGDNSYSGGTTVSAGTLEAGTNTALGTGAVNLTGATLLAANSVTVSNDITVNAGVSGSTVIAYWNFNSLSIATAAAPGSGDVPLTIASGIGGASLSLANWAGTVDDFGGTTINALNSDPAEESLSLILSTNGNGSFIEISGLDLIGYTNVQLAYATQRTSTGFNSNQWSYSSNGTDFTNFSGVVNPATSFGMVTTDATSGLQNVSAGFLRYTLSGATNDSGNNRIDNLRVIASQEAPSLIGSDTAGNATFTGQITLNGTAQLTAAASSNVVFTGPISNGSNGARGIEKIGAGRVELSGANTYSGSTTVTAGTLAVNNTTGSGTGTGNVVVKNAATLAGAGTLSPAAGGSIVFESGSTVSVGNTADTAGQQLSFIPDSGTITTTFSSGSVLEFDLFSNVGNNTSLTTAADRLFLGGSALFESNVTLRVNTSLDSLLFADGDRWTLFDWSTLSITGSANDLALELPTLSATLTWDTSQLFSNGTLAVTIIPEPTRVSLLLLSGLVLALRRRR